MLDDILRHLDALVGFDSRNPPRNIGTDGMFAYLQQQLPGFQFQLTDFGAGAIALLATRGNPTRLINVHMDTVPDSPHWTASPFKLRVQNDRAIGLGACDIKGAAACLLAVAARSEGDAAFLFSSDEEANDARCIAGFLAQGHAFKEVLVAEPTKAEAVLAHRGICSVLMKFQGRAGHASSLDALSSSALHAAVGWGQQALDFVRAQEHQRFGGLTGLRFNIGRIEGGIKANVIAPAAELRFGFRPLPSMSLDHLHQQFRSFVSEAHLASYEQTFMGPSLPAGEVADAEARRLKARDLADDCGLPIGHAVDFWTEASLFSAAGMTALVFGPGDIAQAHTADEWVALEQLNTVAHHYLRILS
ncbi:acetylornithine deacetylase [Pseudomarimonas arenosa]|uniref:N-acetyl-L-citrulline deacetylase n=1 Tax=Pseudomarimonas arenosa TaxID=2774145 RepID=A0AAW3ZK22_9GAMM|nr:acetylornithine deacetylase [Pseudomarimonas arenosa]MBD8526318.1 acetylornithine deacetylase [Pseudomarimonas arenosa]